MFVTRKYVSCAIVTAILIFVNQYGGSWKLYFCDMTLEHDVITNALTLYRLFTTLIMICEVKIKIYFTIYA